MKYYLDPKDGSKPWLYKEVSGGVVAYRRQGGWWESVKNDTWLKELVPISEEEAFLWILTTETEKKEY